METATINIGLNKGKRRILLEGRRLLAAGFVGGLRYACVVKPGSIVMSLPGDDRKITGRPDGKPIIDIIGRDIETAFPTGKQVFVTFRPNHISIRLA